MIDVTLVFYSLGVGSVLGLAFFIGYELYYKPRRVDQLVTILTSIGLTDIEGLKLWTESGPNLFRFEKDVKELVRVKNPVKPVIKPEKKELFKKMWECVKKWEKVLKNKLRKNC